MYISLILSIIGCITGTVSLLINLFKYLDERPKIKVSQLGDDISHYFKADELSNFNSPYHSYIYVEINNYSKNPIVISKIKLNLKEDDGIYALLCTKYPRYEFKYKDEDQRYIVDLDKDALRMPLKLDSYDYKSGYLFFPFTPELNENVVHTNLTIFTTRGNFNAPVSLRPLPIDDSKEFNSLHERYHLKH